MATHAFAELNIPESAELADYYGIRDDLHSAHMIALQILEISRSKAPEYSLLDSLWTAFFVKYARPFTTGVRKRIDAAILDNFTLAQRSHHDMVIAVRDKYVAHSVNSYEENRPVAYYRVEYAYQSGIESISCQRERLVGFGDSDLQDFIEIIFLLIKIIDERIKEEEARVLTIARTLPLPDVIAGKYNFPRTKTDNPIKPRPRLK